MDRQGQQPRVDESPPSSAKTAEPTPASRHPSRRQKAKVGFAGGVGWLGIFGIGAAIGAIMGWQDVRGWVIGVVVSGVTVILGYLLRRSLPSV
jgi:hypothetical protein